MAGGNTTVPTSPHLKHAFCQLFPVLMFNDDLFPWVSCSYFLHVLPPSTLLKLFKLVARRLVLALTSNPSKDLSFFSSFFLISYHPPFRLLLFLPRFNSYFHAGFWVFLYLFSVYSTDLSYFLKFLMSLTISFPLSLFLLFHFSSFLSRFFLSLLLHFNLSLFLSIVVFRLIFDSPFLYRRFLLSLFSP